MTVELDLVAAALARDSAIQQVDNHADPAWKARALIAIYHVAQTWPEFIVDAVWRELGERPREGRAMGARMRKAAAMGWIEGTDRFVPTAQPQRHASPCRVWRSLIWGRP